MMGQQPDSPCLFSYIPSFLHYIVLELLKNSFVATVKNAADDSDLQARPVRILVCHDEQRVAIMIADRAGGIPLDVGDRIWSYLYGACAREDRSATSTATSLGGYGVGLPLSRLYAQSLGGRRGRLVVTSYPGYGTQAHLLLPRLDDLMLESINPP